MTIIEDTRNQKQKHELKHKRFKDHGVIVTRSKIVVGDYCKPPEVSVDTKASIAEIAQNIGGTREEHERFIREIKFAQQLGTKLFILVENDEGIEDIDGVESWHNPREAFSPKCIQGPRLAKAMHTIETRYGCEFRFCSPEKAADVIMDLLR